MEFLNMIGSMFQLPALYTEDLSSLTAEKPVSVTGEHPLAECFSAAVITGGRSSGAKINKTDIGCPLNFKHVAHIGWNSPFGNDPAVNLDLQRIFNKAGIREEHLKDRRTSQRIFEVIEKRGGVEAVRQEALSIDLPEGSCSCYPALESLATLDTSSRPSVAVPQLPLTFSHYCPIASVPAPPPLPPFNDSAAVDSVPVPPPLPPFLNHTSIASVPPPLLPSFNNSAAVDSVPIPPPLPPFLNHTSIASVPPPAPPLPPFFNNSAAVDSVPIPPPLPPFLNKCTSVAFAPPPPPPLPQFFNNSTSSAAFPPPLMPAFNFYAPIDSHNVPAPPPLPAYFNTISSTDCLSPLPPLPCSRRTSVSSPLPPPPPPPPSPFINVYSCDYMLPPPLHPSQLGRLEIQLPQSGKGTKLSEKSSKKQLPTLDSNDLLNQIKKGIQLKSVKKVSHSVSLVSSENEGIVTALMDVIQKRHRATHSSCEDNQSEDEWDD